MFNILFPLHYTKHFKTNRVFFIICMNVFHFLHPQKKAGKSNPRRGDPVTKIIFQITRKRTIKSVLISGDKPVHYCLCSRGLTTPIMITIPQTQFISVGGIEMQSNFSGPDLANKISGSIRFCLYVTSGYCTFSCMEICTIKRV